MLDQQPDPAGPTRCSPAPTITSPARRVRISATSPSTDPHSTNPVIQDDHLRSSDDLAAGHTRIGDCDDLGRETGIGLRASDRLTWGRVCEHFAESGSVRCLVRSRTLCARSPRARSAMGCGGALTRGAGHTYPPALQGIGADWRFWVKRPASAQRQQRAERYRHCPPTGPPNRRSLLQSSGAGTAGHRLIVLPVLRGTTEISFAIGMRNCSQSE